MIRVGLIDDEQVKVGPKVLDIPEHQKVAQQVAEEGIVLLKNDPEILPLDINKTKKIAILGPNAKKIFGIKGHGGSSAVVPPKFITPYEGISNYVSGKVDIVENVEEADAVFLVLGLDHGGTILKAFLFKKEIAATANKINALPAEICNRDALPRGLKPPRSKGPN